MMKMNNNNKTNCNCKSTLSNCTGKYAESEKSDIGYGYYSNVLKKPFERLDDLKKAESVYFEELKAKENKAAQKKADAQKVEDAFKALNAARKEYKEKITQLTEEYATELETLKKAFKLGQKDIHNILATAEDRYSKSLKEFNDAHPEGYHMTLRDGDFETTISRSTKTEASKEVPKAKDIFNLFDLMFNF